MRVTLIQPPQGSRFGFTKVLMVEPLGLECVGAGLELHDHDVHLIDLRLDRGSAMEMHLRASRPGAVGISCGFTSDVYSSLKTAKHVKELLPETTVFVGGHHASLIPGDLLFPGSPVDAVVIGEGESTGAELADAIECGDDPASVAGVMTQENIRNGFQSRPFAVDLDELPLPARGLSQRYRRRYHHGFAVPSACVETSRGCPFDCNFCSVWVFYQRRARRRSPERIVEDLEGVRRLGEGHAFFTDDIAFLDYQAYENLGEQIRAAKLNMRYACETRADLVVKYRDLFSLWKEIGMSTIFLGVEKIDDEGLVSIRKRTKGGANTNIEAIEILRQAGITPMTAMIVDPAWGEEDFDRLEAFIKELKLPNPTFTILTPLPGTELWATAKSDVITHDYSYYDVTHLTLAAKLGEKRFYERFARLAGLVDVRTQLSYRAAWPLLKMVLHGQGWVVRRMHAALREMRDPSAYMRYPGSTRKPDFVPEGFGGVDWVESSKSGLVDAMVASGR